MCKCLLPSARLRGFLATAVLRTWQTLLINHRDQRRREPLHVILEENVPRGSIKRGLQRFTSTPITMELTILPAQIDIELSQSSKALAMDLNVLC
ncbi:hypothetical protein N7509_009519 [Penicillium cosmopolitanum]|uniref:Uncharacterized protein n=1 Tax=Penicillium cosmopolitanum TaxID=1131564 RepID=A0A9W9VPK5_9EURO|nr:uncharacterized protein N7509_009519 [Penicillium cosmopolitanum]KAJ5386978.1 hypothetical protein N7509_009519 [Penicillium cosmopolitanum]